jgi:hypothetical protein
MAASTMNDVDVSSNGNRVDRAVVTEQGAAELMKILLERGYFHERSAADADDEGTEEKDGDDGDDEDNYDDKTDIMNKSNSSFSMSCESGIGGVQTRRGSGIGMNMANSLALMKLDDSFMTSESSPMNIANEGGDEVHGHDATSTYSWDDSVFVVTVEGSYMTVKALRDQYCQHLAEKGRWKSLREAADALGIYEKDVKRVVTTVLQNDSSLLQTGDQVLTQKCLDDMTQQVFDALDKLEGRLAMEDLAKDIYHLPTTVSFDILQNRLKETTIMMRLGNGSKVLVTQVYLDTYRQKVLDHFVTVTEPVKVKAVATEQGWEATWVAKIVRGLVSELPGKLSGDSYVPSVHTEKRNLAVHEFFAANGFLTAKECPAMGILLSEMKEVLSEAFPTAVELKNCVIHPDMIVTPLQAAIQETLEARSWLDLSAHIPGQILSQEEDADTLVREHVLDELDGDEAGIAVVSPEVAIFFSQAFIGDVEKKLLPKLIESFSKTRAEELEGGFEANENGPLVSKKKGKKRASLKSALPPGDLIDDDVVPIEDVIQAVVAAYPDLVEFAITREILAESSLAELFRQAFYTEEFLSACESAVEAETQRLERERASTASRRKDGAYRVQSVEAAFEDPGCFATACYLIQTLAKFVQYAVDSGLSQTDVDALKQDMLNGPCADFTIRITQFCLYKHEVEDNMFSFQAYKIEEEDSSGLPYFCSPVDSATRQFHPTFVSCEPDEESKPRDPLPTLREVLPTSIGVSLARQWVLCGGDCYAGGIKLADDGKSIFTRPGDFDEFRAHVEENCLLMCSLPFKKLDKKSEKNFLMERRKRLAHLLEETTVPQKVLELTVMILFQLSKNLVVTGSLLRGPILELLTKERKVAAEVAESLRELAESIEKGGDVDEALVERVKDCGLGRG